MIGSVFKYITGIVKLRGATDNTQIGNSADRLRTEATQSGAWTNFITPITGTFTDKSGTATAVASTLAAANSTRKYLFVQNVSTGILWINFGVTAVASRPSIKLAAGDSFVIEGSFISTELVSVISGGGSRDFTAKEGN